MKLNVHFRATVHFKDCPLSPLRIVYFGLDSKTSPLWDFWTILFDSNQDYLLFGPSTLTSLIPLLWLMIVHFGWKIWTLIRPCFQWFLLLKVIIPKLKICQMQNNQLIHAILWKWSHPITPYLFLVLYVFQIDTDQMALSSQEYRPIRGQESTISLKTWSVEVYWTYNIYLIIK